MTDHSIKQPYVYIQNDKTGQTAIKLTEEPFAGIIYEYGEWSIDESTVEENSEESVSISLSFDYNIIDMNGKQFGNIEPFEEYIGMVLQDIIHHAVSEEIERQTKE